MVIIGCGRIVELAHGPALRRAAGFGVTALVDPSAERRAAVAALLGAQDVVHAEEPSPDLVRDAVVVLASPSPLRSELMGRVVSHARAVVVEKPLVSRTEDAPEVLEGAYSADTHLVPVHNWLYDPAVAELGARVASGWLGELRSMSYYHHTTGPFAGAWAHRPLWRADDPGGCLADLGYHACYLVGAVVGRPTGIEVSASTRTAGVLTSARVVLRTATGVDCRVAVSWSAARPEFRIRVVGSRATAEVGDDGVLTLHRDGRTDELRHPAGFPVAYRRFYHDVADRVRHAPDYCDATAAVLITRLMEEAIAGAPRREERSAR
ncbi:Gfo/Idh/MocA family oxidoreductase [Actinosynnema sp. NPDC050436]|uniref:Gfo/Idh/MocA family protein n=1 Tax=Actinosynnema sp. NPDC050436 TaxID=3155659 RepID=UPI0033C5D2B7